MLLCHIRARAVLEARPRVAYEEMVRAPDPNARCEGEHRPEDVRACADLLTKKLANGPVSGEYRLGVDFESLLARASDARRESHQFMDLPQKPVECKSLQVIAVTLSC